MLPPARAFVGREREIAALQAWAAATEPPRVFAVVAMGGAGKSSLVQRALESRDGEPFVWSFYEDPRAESFIKAALARTTGRVAPKATSEALEELLGAVCSETQNLWVLDGFEVMQSEGRGRPRGSIDDPQLRRLLQVIADRGGGLRVVVTTRVVLADLEPWEGRGVRALQLGPLDAEPQRQLLRDWGVHGTDAQLDRALERFGGHALSVATLASHVTGAYAGDVTLLGALDLEEAAQDERLAHRLARLLDAYAATMTEAQRDLLARVAVFPRGADLGPLLAIASDPELRGTMPTTRRDLVRTLSRLEALGLVHRSQEASSRYGVHALVAEHFREQLGNTARAIHGARREALLQRDLDLDGTEALFVHTVLAGHPRDAFDVYERRLGGFSRLGLERGDMVRGARLLRHFLTDDDPGAVDPGLPTWQRLSVLYDQALYATALGDPDFALACLQRCITAANGEPRMHTTGLRTSAYVFRLMGRYDEALDTVQRALEAASDVPGHRVRNLALQAAIHHDRGEADDAARCFEQARALDPLPRFRRALWESEYLVERGDLDRAEAIALENRELCVRRQWAGHVSHCDVVLGLCAVHRDPEAAAARLTGARRWAHESGEVEAQLRCFEVELRLQPNGPARDRVLDRALSLARGARFGRFETRLAWRCGGGS